MCDCDLLVLALFSDEHVKVLSLTDVKVMLCCVFSITSGWIRSCSSWSPAGSSSRTPSGSSKDAQSQIEKACPLHCLLKCKDLISITDARTDLNILNLKLGLTERD